MVELKDILKVIIILGGFVVIVTGTAWMSSRQAWARRAVLCLIAFMLVRPPGNFTLMLYSVDWYRGHTKGFEFNFLEMFALGLIVGAAATGKRVKLLPPGAILYAIYCLASLLSIVAAYNQIYVLMGFFKFALAFVIAMGVCHAIEGKEDIRWLLRTFALALVVNLLVALKMRYVDGRYQIPAWFEHQNPMAMWCYFLGLILLAVALAKDIRWGDTLIFFIGFAAAGMSILLSVSRASLAAIGAGAVFILAVSLLRGINVKRLGILLIMSSAGALALFLAMDTLAHRIESSEDTGPENDLRWILNQQSRAMLEDSPLGVGWNNFGLANSRPYGAEYSQMLEKWNANRGHTIVTAHYKANPLTESHYWLLLAENGYPGFIAYVLFALATLWWCLRGVWHYRRSYLGFLCLGCGVALGITYLHSNLERVLTQTKNLGTWMVVLGMLMRVERWRRQGYRPATWDGKYDASGQTHSAPKTAPVPTRRRTRYLTSTSTTDA